MVTRLCRVRYPTLATPGNGRGAAGASEADRSIRSKYAVYLPGHRKQYGFDNMDFDFEAHGMIFDGKCLATVALPDYAITSIRTGQYVPVEGDFHHLCEEELRR